MGKKKCRVVVIGGGTGLSTVLRGLKNGPFSITAIVTVADDGGSSGKIRGEYDIPPPGDVRNVIAALSEVEPLVEQMFQYRFADSKQLEGHSLGNLMLTALTDITGDFSHAIAEMSKVLNVKGKVLPAANKKVTLHAELKDGTYIEGESQIPEVTSPIQRVFLSPCNIKALPAAIRALYRADVILLGPGSLYTSIIPNLLVKEIKTAILRAKASKIYICNLMTQKGETIDYSAADHIEVIHQHVGQPFIDTILVNQYKLPYKVIQNYEKEQAQPVIFDIARIENMGIKVIEKEIAIVQDGAIRHNAENVAIFLEEYLGDKRHLKCM